MDNNSKFSFFRRSRENKNNADKIEFEVNVQRMVLELQNVYEYAKNHLSDDNKKVDEVIIVDSSADPKLLKIVEGVSKVKVGDSIEVIYLMDAVQGEVEKILCLCVDSFSDELKKELELNNHIIRITNE